MEHELRKVSISLAANPKLSSWINFDSGGLVIVSPGKVEIGQGIVTALAQIAADELDVEFARVRMVRASTAGSPNEGVTSGSLSVQHSGRAIRFACAEIRKLFLDAAAERLGVASDVLSIHDGTIAGPGNVSTSYWELANDISLDRGATAGVTPKLSDQRAIAGHSVQRLDIPDKIFGRPRFIHDLALPGLLHGRVLRADFLHATLVELNEDRARQVEGLIAIVRDGNFAGVVCETEPSAEKALAALRKGATWSSRETLPDEDDFAAWSKSQPAETAVIASKKAASPSAKVRTLKQQYTRPYIAHGSIAPSCAMAQWDGERVKVWTHSQGVYLLRSDLALVLKLPADDITVEHVEGSGCYGHNGADDVALDAVLLAKAANGRPVRLQWSRTDEMSHAPFGAAMTIEIEADLDAMARSSAGAIASGATATPRVPAAPISRHCLRRPNSPRHFRAPLRSIHRRALVAVPTAIRFRCMTFRRGCRGTSSHHDADPCLRAPNARRAGQCVCDRVLSR